MEIRLVPTIAMEALKVVRDEKLTQNARKLGKIFREEMNRYIQDSSIVTLVRGRGLLNAIVINDGEESDTAWNICLRLRTKDCWLNQHTEILFDLPLL